jgi:hypothetical protein
VNFDKVKVDHRGIESAAKSSEMHREINALAEKVADNVRSMGIMVEGEPGDISLPVNVLEGETDRARASVQIAHPSGQAVQAKHGCLTKAAAQEGLEVKSE